MSHFSLADPQLVAIAESDFATVSRLGNSIWRSHYPDFLSAAQIEYMLAGRYTPDKLRTYVNAADRWLMLLNLAASPVGYCSYALSANAGELKLEQLYLLPEFKGRGLGGFMMRHVESEARRLGRGVVVLHVNRHNGGAIAVYRKAGFTLREEAVFDIGGGFVMDDLVMEKMLRD